MTEEPTKRPATAESPPPPTTEGPPPSTADSPERLRHRIRWGLVTLAALALAIGFLAYQNIDEVPVRAFWWEFNTPLLVVVVATAALTLAFHTLVRLVIRWRRRRQRRDFERSYRQTGRKG